MSDTSKESDAGEKKDEKEEPGEGLFEYFTKVGKDDSPTSDSDAPAP